MKVIKGNVTTPKGFKANGLWCGIKRSKKPDLALIVSDVPAVAAGVFTTNSVKAAPLVVSKAHLRNNKAQAIICNSGNANCFTGKFGYTYADRTTQMAGELLDIPKNNVVVASTGIIGRPLPYGKIEKASKKLVNGLSRTGGAKAAKAILTTDLKTKEICVQETIGGKRITIGGIAKGSGMVAPNMATMLAFLTTDAAISEKMLKQALSYATDRSFNAITVDGCMSTNDMAIVLANGLAKNSSINKPGKEFNKFVAALTFVCQDLAKKMVIDGEGATKFVSITVSGAKTHAQAKKIGLAIANSNLVKTALHGSNPNWGRVAGAVGSIGIKNVTEKNLRINFSDFKRKNVNIDVDLNIGQETATVYTCDLSYEYVRINAEYN